MRLMFKEGYKEVSKEREMKTEKKKRGSAIERWE